MKAAEFKPLIGKRVRYWNKRPARGGGWFEPHDLKAMHIEASGVGEVVEVRGQNVLIGNDYAWAPDVLLVEEIA